MSPNKDNNDKQTQLLSTSGPQIQPSEKSGGLGAPADNILKSVLFGGRDAKTGPAPAGGSGQSGGSGTYTDTLQTGARFASIQTKHTDAATRRKDAE